MMAAGMAHVPIWWLSGTDWSGPISFRKPILFGLSTGVTALSVTWVSTKIPWNRFDHWFIHVFSWSLGIEVFLITLQQWRGVASHFNRSTPLDAAILTAIEILITSATAYILYLTLRVWGRLDASPAMKVAIRYGMLLLLLGCLLGFVITMLGYQAITAGANPGIYGRAGVLKFPHGIPLHAIQLLPILVALSQALNWSQNFQSKLIQSGFFLTIGLTLFGAIQTFSGNARFEFGILPYTVLAATILSSIAILFTTTRSK